MRYKFQLVKYKQPSNLKYAARCLPLGLTAYGDTEDDAWESLIRMFKANVVIERKNKTYQEVEK